MSSVDHLRRFVGERLSAAAEEIFGVFHKTIVQYEEEIERQRKLLDVVLRPEIKLRRIELQQQRVCKEKEVQTEQQQQQQQQWNQEGNSSLDQEEPEAPQIKEEQEEQLGLKQESDDFLLTSTSEQNGQSENWTLHWNPDVYPAESQVKMPIIVSVISQVNSELQQLPDNSHAAEGQDWNKGKHVDSESNSGKRLNGKRPKCPANDVYYTTSLTTHSKTGSESFQCDTCGQDFSCESLFKQHLTVHAGEKQYVCKTCGKGFVKSGNLKVHCRTHTGEKPYLCKNCGKAFANSSSLMVHMRSVHTGEKPYLCKTCGKAFAERSSLVVHTRRVHTGERPYLCMTCGECFVICADLSRHTRKVHTGERPYLCKTCGKSFLIKTNLSRHIRRVHIVEKRFVCSLCGKGFFDSTHLSRHKRTHKDR